MYVLVFFSLKTRYSSNFSKENYCLFHHSRLFNKKIILIFSSFFFRLWRIVRCSHFVNFVVNFFLLSNVWKSYQTTSVERIFGYRQNLLFYYMRMWHNNYCILNKKPTEKWINCLLKFNNKKLTNCAKFKRL